MDIHADLSIREDEISSQKPQIQYRESQEGRVIGRTRQRESGGQGDSQDQYRESQEGRVIGRTSTERVRRAG